MLWSCETEACRPVPHTIRMRNHARQQFLFAENLKFCVVRKCLWFRNFAVQNDAFLSCFKEGDFVYFEINTFSPNIFDVIL